MYVRHYATARAQEATAFHTRFVADTILKNQLRLADFVQPVSGARRARLDALFREEVLVSGALRVKLYARGGYVTYSNDHALIGSVSPQRKRVDIFRTRPTEGGSNA